MNARLPFARLMVANTSQTKTTMISAPAAGRARMRWVSESRRSRSDPGAGPASAVVVAIITSEGCREGPTRWPVPPMRRVAGA